MTIATDLARFALEHVPSDTAVAAATASAIDSIGAALVTSARPFADSLIEFARGSGSVGSSHVIGRTETFDASRAAWINSALMHAEDFDDTPHTSYFLAALLVTATEEASSASDFVAAWSVSYNVWNVCVSMLGVDRPFNPTSIVAPLAAAAGVARLRGLDLETTARALAIATSNGAGLRGQFGTDMKSLDAARSASGGLDAVRMAVAGWTADDAIIERDNGWIAAYGGRRADPQAVEILAQHDVRTFPLIGSGPRFKAWPCCARHIEPITALLSLLNQHEITGDDISSIAVEVGFEQESTAVFRVVPRTPLEAKFSIPYVMAAAAWYGRIDTSTFDADVFDRIRSGPLIDNVTVHYVQARSFVSGIPSTSVSVRTVDGLVHTSEHIGLIGLDVDEIRDKFVTNVSPILGSTRATNVVTALSSLSSPNSSIVVGDLLAHLVPSEPLNDRSRS